VVCRWPTTWRTSSKLQWHQRLDRSLLWPVLLLSANCHHCQLMAYISNHGLEWNN